MPLVFAKYESSLPYKLYRLLRKYMYLHIRFGKKTSVVLVCYNKTFVLISLSFSLYLNLNQYEAMMGGLRHLDVDVSLNLSL